MTPALERMNGAKQVIMVRDDKQPNENAEEVGRGGDQQRRVARGSETPIRKCTYIV